MKSKNRNPWFFIPTLYFSEGVPYVLVNSVSVILYKRLGFENDVIAFWTSLLYLPWVVKMFWSPYVELYKSKRQWITWTQGLMSLALFLIALFLHTPLFFVASLVLLTVCAFISATHDIAVDGFYLLSLNEDRQAFFVGIRSFFYRSAMIFTSGILVALAGFWEKSLGDVVWAWFWIWMIAAFIFLILGRYHSSVLPYPDENLAAKNKIQRGMRQFKEIFASYFCQKKIGIIVGFILCYRLGEAMLVKMVSPFLLDSRLEGGLGLSTVDVGMAYGTAGVIALMLGGFLGGWWISRSGLKKCLGVMALALNLPDLFYVYMAYAKPSLIWVYALVSLEQFGYGFGFAGFMVYLMHVSRSQYQTAHYAISTGLMALGMMIPGMISGALEKAMGYGPFFVLVTLAAIPGMILIFFLPWREYEK